MGDSTGQSSIAFRMFSWPIIIGVIGFLCGFFGPIVFDPGANQGPLLGIFFSGPVSVVLGIILGRISIHRKFSRHKNYVFLVTASIVLASITLLVSMPGPRYIGTVIDGEIKNCQKPENLIAERIAWWKNNLNEQGQSPKNLGWENEITQKIKNDAGVVLSVFIYRERDLYELRKPWNRGLIEPNRWKEVNSEKNFYARYLGASCSMYESQSRQTFSFKWEVSTVSPPDILPSFLGLYVLEPIAGK